MKNIPRVLSVGSVGAKKQISEILGQIRICREILRKISNFHSDKFSIFFFIKKLSHNRSADITTQLHNSVCMQLLTPPLQLQKGNQIKISSLERPSNDTGTRQVDEVEGIEGRKNKALFPAHWVMIIYLMRAAPKYVFGQCIKINMDENSLFYFSSHNYGIDELKIDNTAVDHFKI